MIKSAMAGRRSLSISRSMHSGRSTDPGGGDPRHGEPVRPLVLRSAAGVQGGLPQPGQQARPRGDGQQHASSGSILRNVQDAPYCPVTDRTVQGQPVGCRSQETDGEYRIIRTVGIYHLAQRDDRQQVPAAEAIHQTGDPTANPEPVVAGGTGGAVPAPAGRYPDHGGDHGDLRTAPGGGVRVADQRFRPRVDDADGTAREGGKDRRVPVSMPGLAEKINLAAAAGHPSGLLFPSPRTAGGIPTSGRRSPGRPRRRELHGTSIRT